MKVKTATLLIAFCINLIEAVNAQESQINKGTGFGFQINQYERDFGMGLSATSPYFAHHAIAVRARGNLMFYEHPENGATVWTGYSNVSLGLVGVGGYVAGVIRLYGEGGIIALFPSDNFSTKDFVIGGYGVFGFEFFMSEMTNYFIEIGAVGTGAVADKISNEPIYSNGLLISTGFRIQLK